MQPHLLEGVGEGVTAGVLAEHDLAAGLPHCCGVDDLVGRALGQHAVLMDAGLVGERVAPDDGLVRRHRVAGQAGDHTAGARQLARVDAGFQAMGVAPSPQQHHDLLERAVARALADAVDGALDLASACDHPRVGVGDGQPQVVVAVN